MLSEVVTVKSFASLLSSSMFYFSFYLKFWEVYLCKESAFVFCYEVLVSETIHRWWNLREASRREIDDELERSRVGEISTFPTRLSCHVSTEKMVIYHLGGGTFPDTQSADNLILSFSPSRTDRNDFLLFIAHLLQGILLQQSEKIKILQLIFFTLYSMFYSFKHWSLSNVSFWWHFFCFSSSFLK